MLGAIAGDMIGAPYERNPIKSTAFPLFTSASCFTDDTVLTIALADSILSGEDYCDMLKEYFALYPHAGYGEAFYRWAQSESCEPYNSWGNGSAMRVSPVGWGYDTLDQVLEEARRSAAVTHNHPEGIKGAQAIAASVFKARTGSSKDEIREFVEQAFDYSLGDTLEHIRPYYQFDVSCAGSVPQAITAFLESNSFEDAVRKGVSLGGDSDTIGCMAGAVAHAYYGNLPAEIKREVYDRLDGPLLEIVEAFVEAYDCA